MKKTPVPSSAPAGETPPSRRSAPSFWDKLPALLAGLSTVAILPSASAASATWNGTTDGVWATGANWSTTPVPGTGDTATFNSAGNANTTLDLGAGVTLGTSLFDTASAAAYTIGSGAVGSQTLTFGTLNGGITLNSTVAANQLFNANIALATTGNYNFTNNSTTNGLTIAGGISASTAGAKTLTVTGAGNTSITGNITAGSGSVAITKTGTGTLSLSGTNTTGNAALSVTGGTANITGGTTTLGTGTVSTGAASGIARLNLTGNSTVTSSTTTFTNYAGNAANTIGVINIASGSSLTTTSSNSSAGGNIGAGGANAAGSIYNAGTLTNNARAAGGAGFFLGNAANSYGYLQSSGTTNIDARLGIGQLATGAGVVDINGGTTTVSGLNQTTANTTIQVNSGNTGSSVASLNVTNGGTLLDNKTGDQIKINTNTSGANSQYASVNVSGASSLLNTSTSGASIDLGVGSIATNTATLSLHNGGTLATQFITKSGANAVGILNFNGGTLKANFTDATGIIRSGVTTYVHSGGATIDTNGVNTTIASALQAPTGNGVTSIALGGTQTGYIGAPVVKFSGGGGTGAAGYANFDPATGTVTGITITSPGTGYTSAPTITLLGGSGTTGIGAGAGAATATATLGAVASGGLTKTGTGTLTLSAANTYTGATTVSAGTLALSSAGSLASTAYSIANGATLDVSAKSGGYSLSGINLTVGSNGTTAGLLNGGAIALTLGGNLAVNFTSGTLVGSSLNLLDYGSQTGDFSTVALTGSITGSLALTGTDLWTGTYGGYNFSFDETSGVLNFTAVPEPHEWALVITGLLALIVVRRRQLSR